jgi:enterochelin esterase-like enzyme
MRMRQMDKERFGPNTGLGGRRLTGLRLVGLFLLVTCAFLACSPSKLSTPARTEPVKISTLTPLPPAPSATLRPPSATPSLPPATATESCLSKPGQLVKGVIETALLDKPMTYTVYLPPCYAAEPERRYPVLYLLHGQNDTEAQWVRLGAPTQADKLISAGQAAPFIIVFPYDYSYKQPGEYRFEDVFLELLIPQIDRAYRTRPEAAQRAIGGLSRGGAWALRMGLHHPEVFGAIGAHSPAIFYSDTNSLPLIVRDLPAAQLPRIYIDIGDSDSEFELVERFKNFLNDHNIPHEWHEYVGFHDEKYWSAHVAEYLRWYAQGWHQ